jgi:tricorn protease
VYGWTPDSKHIVFRSLRDANGGSVETALYTVSAEGGLAVKLPMPSSGAGDFSPDGKKIVYSPLFRDFRTWKRYEGGWAQDLYIFDLSSYEAVKIGATERTERDPMWIGEEVYFVSDRDGTLNLYSYNVNSGSVSQLTRNTVWDVRWASSDNKGKIIYELNGELQIYDIVSTENRKVSLTVPDDGLHKRPSRYSAQKNIEDFELSPKGERALFVARGDIFTAPIEKGPTRNLTNSSNAHDKRARWSPDGSKIAFISDIDGEEQVYIIDQLGKGEAEKLSSEFKATLYTPEWSPDGKRLAFSDKNGKLYVLNIAAKKAIEIADDAYGRIFDYSWSPNGGFLAFSMSDWSGYNSIYIWSVTESKVRRITGEYFNEYGPAWDPQGKYLFYLSDREFAPQLSSWEWNFAGNRSTGIFAMTLRTDVEHPFAPESDEVSVGEEEEKKEKDEKDKKGKKEKKGYIKIDFSGLDQRIAPVPVEADNIDGLSAIEGHLLYVKYGAPFYGRDSYEKVSLQIFDVEKRKASTLVDDINGYALSSNGKKVLVQQEKAYHLYDAKPEAKDKKTVSTNDLMVDRIPVQEWEQIFNEVWRRYRDFFYVRNMHGYDWEAIREQYKPLLKYVAHRSDLNYLMGEMVAELSAGHCYIQGGDFEIPDRPKVGLPGARFELDTKAGRYRIAKILQGNNEEKKYRAPLTEIGVNVKVGDYLLAINGEALKANDNPYRLLQHKTDPVILTVNSKPNLTGSRKVTYNPVTSESSLLYKEWVDINRKKVSELSTGRLAYMHLPNMGGSGIYEFIKWYYPQIRKEGFIVDVRSNGGGNVSQMIIERLDSKVMGTRFGYNSDKPITYPYTAFHGHMVCLINETSASDGDIFPHYFREAGLGPLIGKRSWGGVVGYSGTGPLLDGASIAIPMRGTNDTEGNYIIEGIGVLPDMEVDNDPKSVLQGRDLQLEQGVQEVLEMIDKIPKQLPQRPPDPVKTK